MQRLTCPRCETEHVSKDKNCMICGFDFTQERHSTNKQDMEKVPPKQSIVASTNTHECECEKSKYNKFSLLIQAFLFVLASFISLYMINVSGANRHIPWEYVMSTYVLTEILLILFWIDYNKRFLHNFFRFLFILYLMALIAFCFYNTAAYWPH